MTFFLALVERHFQHELQDESKYLKVESERFKIDYSQDYVLGTYLFAVVHSKRQKKKNAPALAEVYLKDGYLIKEKIL